MANLKSILIFLLQSIVVGLAVAFLVVLLRPELLPAINGGTAGQQTASYANAVDIGAPSVANVYTRKLQRGGGDADGRAQVTTGIGSAVIIDREGYLVTNYHVIAGAAEIRVQLADGRIANPERVGHDVETDLALLKVNLGDLPAIPLGRSGDLRVGDVVLAIGNPFGLTKTVTQGIVSATGRGFLRLMTFENYIQTDAAINEGNSGGALINVRGELVGINTAVLAEGTGTEGISFAIPVDLVRGVVEEIRLHGRVIRGYIGLRPAELTRAEALAQGIDPEVGIILEEVFSTGPAWAAGLRPGDIVLQIDGQPIRSSQQALLLVARKEPGDEARVVVWRDGSRQEFVVTVTERLERSAQ